ncbi:DUF3298 and DUF4163 domain-containing protein [Clostridium sp. ZBS15]|uniref:DUF3298 and DUF4163 domain-containing protein n=1 Tax=Clostridium sp. ZBS15 TaxID=2949969 RepID=UPI00207A1E2B|nr:DUF3298 and DUF4163 domain-containing protein [Clostridium sp. ZBS15]
MKRNYIRKIILASLALIMTTSIFLGYGQKANAATIINDTSKIQVVENTITNDSAYLKENIKLFNFKAEDNNEKINILNKKINNDIDLLLSEMRAYSKEDFDMFGKEFVAFPYEVNIDYKLTNQSDSLISLYMDIYRYSGGAHGNTLRSSYTIDKNTKDLVSLNNLFTNGYDYKKIINDSISKQIATNPENYFESAINFEGINDDVNFYIDGDNLIIYYQQYEIAPYCCGMPEFKISLSLFGENYLYHNSINH